MTTTTGTDLQQAADFLRQGFVVAIPTETVYGLAGNALDEKPVLDIFKLKNRPAFDPLIVHVSGIDQAENLVMEIPDRARPLMKKFWPGPLTLLFPKKKIIPDLVTSGLDTVAIRMPAHPLTVRLLEMIDFPLAAPSANPFGYVSPTTAAHVGRHFDGKIPYILDGGKCRVGIESTIVGFMDDQCVVYRLGGVSVHDIESVTGPVILHKPEGDSASPAPGMLKSHYAPSRKLFFGDVEMMTRGISKGHAAVICLKRDGREFPEGFMIKELSPEGNLEEAARELFAVMRELDQMDVECIYADRFPEHGLGRAINDRLLRASVRL